MLMEERQKEIADWLEKQHSLTIAEITERYGISSESARRDLRILESKGLCKRTYGGAWKPSQVSVRPPQDRNFDELPVFSNYDKIAQKAASYINKNDIVYLTGGSFGYLMLNHLPKDFFYTLVVNSIDLANRLRSMDNIDVYMAGGKMRRSASIVDTMATDFVSKLHFDLAFLTGGGLTADFGLSNGTDETATFQRKVIENSRKKILLLPSHKIGVNSFIKVCNIDCFDLLITDWNCVEDELTKIEEKGTEIYIVEEENKNNGTDTGAETSESDS